MGRTTRAMKLAVIAIFALVAVSFADEFSTTLDETDFLREHANLAAGAKAKVATKDTARAQEMAMARATLHKVITKLGKRHPEMLGEAAAVEQFAKEPLSAGKLDGGYTKLKKVLDKVDNLEKELKAEGAIMDGYAGDIEDARRNIAASLKAEGGNDSRSFQTQMKAQLKAVRKAYSEYWVNTDDRAQVRNILMQALWLVCTGFRSFRHHKYCETLRKQPDYAEPGKPQSALTGTDGGSKFVADSAMSDKFSKTMKSVWSQQKVADANAVNKDDGDVDMEKGFVNNRAPWGVDPAPAKEMTQTQLASRLSFLLETSTAPTRVASPIAGFISALQEGNAETAGTSKGLVDMLVVMDREEGQAQAKEDAEWYATVLSARKATNDFAEAQEDLADAQNKWTAEISQLEEKMNFIKMSVVDYEKAEMKIAAAMKLELNQCELSYIEFDAILEVVAEELVNVQRLNSLMRFLALDQKPACTSNSGKPCTDDEQGSCTWMTRGGTHKGGANKESTFCACEYGFYGKNCELRTCPGFGRIRYKAGQDGVCSNGGRCDTATGTCKEIRCFFRRYHGPKSKCEYIRCPKAVNRSGKPVYMTAKDDPKIACSGQRNGLCNVKRGKCECTADYWGVHCGYKKCPASNARGEVVGLFRGTSANACDGRGACVPTGSKWGTCVCSGQHYYGNACQFANCGGGGSDKNQCQGKGKCDAKTGLCFCSKGNYGGSNCKLCRPCHYKTCSANCNTGGSGHCNRIAGYCVCNSKGTYNGEVCKSPCRRDAYESNWSRSMDKWGWSVCKKGWLLTGIGSDGRGDALYNMDRGKCERPCEGNGKETIAISHCYHENWWKKFDSKGGKFCRRNYFVAGLFRSHCNSLYCLEMAKCCQVKRSLWTKCSWTEISSSFAKRRSMSTVAGNIGFIAGFYRGSSHTLAGFKYFRQCEPIFYGSNYR